MSTHVCVVCGREYEWVPQPNRPPNTCSAECRHRRHVQMNEESRQRAVSRGCPPDKHGTVTGYSHYKCACVLCRKWASEYQKERRHKAAGKK